MPRVEIELPGTFAFTTELPLRVDDLNYGGHLGNDRVLTLAQEVRVRWLASHGLGELDVGGGAGLIMTEAAALYRAEGRYGMVLRGELAVGEVRTRTLELLHRFTDAATGEEIARVRTQLCCFDYRARRLVSLPDRLRRAVGGA